MSHIYCTECGNKIEYSYSKPKFCSGCGAKCGTGEFKKERPGTFAKEESLAEDETSINEVPDIQGLAVETESHGNDVFTFGSLIGEEPRSKRTRNKGSKSLEDFINDRKG